jgi:hypothetical protein
MGIYRRAMPKRPPINPQVKRGRPATGKSKVKLSASASPALIAAAAKAAAKKNESFSAYVSRAIQTQLLNDYE